MKKFTFATIVASGLTTLAIGLAAPTVAASPGAGFSQSGSADLNPYAADGQTPYGTYQNDDKRRVNHHN